MHQLSMRHGLERSKLHYDEPQFAAIIFHGAKDQRMEPPDAPTRQIEGDSAKSPDAKK